LGGHVAGYTEVFIVWVLHRHSFVVGDERNTCGRLLFDDVFMSSVDGNFGAFLSTLLFSRPTVANLVERWGPVIDTGGFELAGFAVMVYHSVIEDHAVVPTRRPAPVRA
jgi:hypothetical protein